MVTKPLTPNSFLALAMAPIHDILPFIDLDDFLEDFLEDFLFKDFLELLGFLT